MESAEPTVTSRHTPKIIGSGVPSHSHVVALIGDLNLLRSTLGTSLRPFVILRGWHDIIRYSRYCQNGAVVADPSTHPNEFICDLVELGTRFAHRPTLLTSNDGVLLLLSRHRSKLERYYLMPLPPASMVEALVDKTRFVSFAREFSLPVPKSVSSEELHGDQAPLDGLQPPYAIKPHARHEGWQDSDVARADGGAPRKICFAKSRDELERTIELVRAIAPRFVVQSFVPGDEACVYSYHAYIDRSGKPLAWFVGRKIRTYPRECGMSTHLELVHAPEIAQEGLNLLGRLGFWGPVKVDFKRDPTTGRLYLLEINPRCTLWAYLGAVNGVNIPLAIVHDLNEEAALQNTGYRVRIRWISLANDLRTYLKHYLRAGDLSWSRYLVSLAHPKIYDVFSWRDPLPAAHRLWLRIRRSMGMTPFDSARRRLDAGR